MNLQDFSDTLSKNSYECFTQIGVDGVIRFAYILILTRLPILFVIKCGLLESLPVVYLH